MAALPTFDYNKHNDLFAGWRPSLFFLMRDLLKDSPGRDREGSMKKTKLLFSADEKDRGSSSESPTNSNEENR
jgi:hypothetical protein